MDTAKKKILYVDDEVINLRVFQLMFQKTFDIVLAESPHMALQQIEEHNDIDILISDLKMPEINGMELIALCQQKSFVKPCFILSGFTISDEIQTAINSGKLSGYFTKPIDKSHVLEVLGRLK